MIPAFPKFKKLEFSDKEEIESVTRRFPVYSDFDFASLWAWNVKDDMEASLLNGNLVLRFSDYLTGEAFYTFIGDNDADGTAHALIAFSKEQGCGGELRLIPETTAARLDPSRFTVTESRDHFDYVFDIDRYRTYGGGKLKSRRNLLNNFKKRYPGYEAVQLDLTDPTTRGMVTDLYRHWQENKGFLSLSESFAYDRFLEVIGHFEHSTVGLMHDGKLIAFHVSNLPPGDYANGLFEKGNIEYTGIYQALMHEVAKDLLARGKKYLNYEQDLGLDTLRKGKSAFDPVHFMKKYDVSEKA